MSGECRWMDRMTDHGRKVMSVEAWDGDHKGHGEKMWKPLEHAPEGYAYAWICCPCGSQHLRHREGAPND